MDNVLVFSNTKRTSLLCGQTSLAGMPDFEPGMGAAGLDKDAHTRAFWKRLKDTVLTWHRRWTHRREIRLHYLAESDSVLADLGVTRDDLAQEAFKPFWRA